MVKHSTLKIGGIYRVKFTQIYCRVLKDCGSGYYQTQLLALTEDVRRPLGDDQGKQYFVAELTFTIRNFRGVDLTDFMDNVVIQVRE